MKTLHLREFERGFADASDLVVDGRLDIYPEVENQDLFEIRLTSAATYIHARGWIGTIPVNDSLTIHVNPRVTVANLDRLMEISECKYKHLTRSLRKYEHSGSLYPALVSMYADALTDGVENIFRQGFLKEYQRRQERTSTPHGRILAGPTIQLSEGRSQHHRAVSTWFQRSADIAANKCLLFAVHRLAAYNQQFKETLTRAEFRRNASRLNHAAQLLSGVSIDFSRRFLLDPIVRGSANLPAVRDYYRDPLDLALAIISGQAVAIAEIGGQLRLPSLLVNMSDVFEAYVRNLLRRTARGEKWPVRVLDGNVSPGRKLLLDRGVHIPAKPDIVLRSEHQGIHRHPVLAEVKYKPASSQPKREDLDQTLAYGLSYRAENVVVVQPRGDPGLTAGLHNLGRIQDIEVWMYVFDTGHEQLPAEEQRFCSAIHQLIGS